MFDLFGRGVSVWSRVGSGAWPLAFVSTERERHLAAAAKPSPPKFISKVRFDTVFDILRKFCSFCVFFFDIFDTILRSAFYRAIQLKFCCAKYRAYRAFSIMPTSEYSLKKFGI